MMTDDTETWGGWGVGGASVARVALLFLVLQQVGRPVARHPSAVHHLQGRVSTGVVHAAQGRVPEWVGGG